MKSAKTTAAIAALTAGLMAFGPVVGPLATVATVYAADYSDATVIDLSQLTAGSYEGYKVAEAEILDGEGNVATDYAGTTVTISEAGTYRITGSASDTNIVVKKGTTGVTLVLDNCSLTCDYTAPIVAKKNTEVTIALVGTSTITDDEDVNNDEDVNPTSYLADYEGACVKAKDGATLTFTGDGTLNVVGNAKHGIRATCNPGEEGETGTCTLNILSGTYNISVQNETGDNATRDGDGIHSDAVLNIGSESMSDADLTINVNQACEGIEGGTVNIYGGSVNVTSTDDGINAANSDYAAAGISYDFAINVYGGTVKVLAGGDGIDSNGNILTQAGNISVCSTSASNGAFDVGDGGSYKWTNVNATVVAAGQGAMEVTPAGTYVAFGTMGGMAGGQMGGMMPQEDAAATTDATTEAAADATAGVTTEGAAELEAQAGGRGQRPSDQGGMGGGQMGGMMGGQTIVTKGQALALSDGTNSIDLGTVLGNAASVIVASPQLTSGTTYTLTADGATVTTATATTGTGQGGMGGGRGGQGGQMPGGQPGQFPSDGQTPPTPPADGQTPPTPPADGQFPGGQPGQFPGEGGQPGQSSQSGWQQSGSSWTYTLADGTTATGWQQVNGVWYFFDAQGTMQTGWVQDGGAWYYLAASGAMATGWVQDGSTWYYLGSSGAMRTGWVQDGGVWYLLGSSGAMLTGWQQAGGLWYFLSGSGAMQTGWVMSNGVWYYCADDGHMFAGTTTPDGYRVDANGAWVQ